MFTDAFLNFFKMTEELGLDYGAETLATFGRHESFAFDTGNNAEDIWKRLVRINECLELFDAEKDKNLVNKIKDNLFFCAGVMPSIKNFENPALSVENLKKTILDFKENGDDFASHLLAIGPCGIDHDWKSYDDNGREHEYYDSQSFYDEQKLFELELELAKKMDMPVILHSRNAFQETMDVLRSVKYNKGMVHGFSYSIKELEFFLNMGWYISFDGSITFNSKNKNEMAEMLDYVPLNRLLIESDSPYYSPIPVRGSVNSPDNLRYIYEYIASKRKMQPLKLNEKIQNNLRKLFDIE